MLVYAVKQGDLKRIYPNMPPSNPRVSLLYYEIKKAFFCFFNEKGYFSR